MSDEKKIDRRAFIVEGSAAVVGVTVAGGARAGAQPAKPAKPSRFSSPAGTGIPYPRAEVRRRARAR
ncbi:MAG: hypothetical protein KBA95_08145, partial [Acidobacteria bacterium]|nr:hypothetical protein [Acidobacteriota bacterium]